MQQWSSAETLAIRGSRSGRDGQKDMNQIYYYIICILTRLYGIYISGNDIWKSSLLLHIITHMRTMVLVYIYLQNLVIFRANVGKYSGTMEHMGYEQVFISNIEIDIK
jgi:hypothetical protein